MKAVRPSVSSAWPAFGVSATCVHAVKDGKHFTQAARLVAIHPIAEALKDEYFYSAWVLRYEAFLRFNYDPDGVFSEKIEQNGFRK